MTETRHRLRANSIPSGLVYECEDDCGRRLVVDRTTGVMTIIDRGDPAALHRGTIGDIELFTVDVQA